jgi:hypothetical protein
MAMLQAMQNLTSAATVFLGPHGSVSRYAADKGVSRQSLYRQADSALAALDPDLAQQPLKDLQQQLKDLQQHNAELRARLARSLFVGHDHLLEFAATAQATGTTLSSAEALLRVFLKDQTPSRAGLGRLAKAAQDKASPALAVLDSFSRPLARQLNADEMFSGRSPILSTVEPESLCWLGARLAPSRDGLEWAKEFRQFPCAEQVTRDAGKGLAKGLELVNQERQQNKLTAIADQDDHFHILYRARRALRQVKSKASKALRKAEQAQRKFDRELRRGRTRDQGNKVRTLNHWWRKAEQAFDRWSAQEGCFERLRVALRLFTPEGELNTREKAEGEVREALAGLTGPEWARVKSQLVGPGAFTYLDRVQEQLKALPAEPGLVRAALRVEGLKRQPEKLREKSAAGAQTRAVVLVASATLALAQAAGEKAVGLVRGVLRGAWRSSSLVESLNSVLRMQQGRQKRLSQGQLDLKRLYWNRHEFVAGKRKGQTPYGRLGLVLPDLSWWNLINLPPEQLLAQLSALNPRPLPCDLINLPPEQLLSKLSALNPRP